MTDEEFKALDDPTAAGETMKALGREWLPSHSTHLVNGVTIRGRRGGMVLYHPGSRLRLGAHGVESVSNMLRRGMRQAALFSRLVSHALGPVAPSWRSGTDVDVARSQICSLQP